MPLLATEPVTFKRDADGNLDPLALYSAASFDSGMTAVMTGVRTRMQQVAGEWFLNLDVGLPLFERDGVDSARVILGNRFDPLLLRAPVLAAILGTPGVSEVLELRITFDAAARHVDITWRARCLFGDTPLDTLTVEA